MSEKYVGVDAYQVGSVIEVMGEKGKCLMHTVIPTRADAIKEFFGGLRGTVHAVGDAELRGWKKRMPFCNGADTGFKVTRPEREQTSIWCPAVKPPEEPRQEGKQMTPSKERWCTFHLRVRGCRLLSLSERAIQTLAGNLVPLVAFERLEPYDGKLSRTVLRGAGAD